MKIELENLYKISRISANDATCNNLNKWLNKDTFQNKKKKKKLIPTLYLLCLYLLESCLCFVTFCLDISGAVNYYLALAKYWSTVALIGKHLCLAATLAGNQQSLGCHLFLKACLYT